MIVTTLLLLIAVFAVMRWLVLRASKLPQLATYVAGATAAALLAGIFLGPFLRGNRVAPVTDPGAVPSAVAAASDAGVARAPKIVRLTKAQLNALVPSSTGALGALDTLGGLGTTVENRYPAGKPISASGWVADPTTKEPADGMFLIIDDARRIDGSATYGLARQDVANAFSTTGLTDTGFSGVEIPTQGLRKGDHIVRLAAIARDRATYYVVTTAWKFSLR